MFFLLIVLTYDKYVIPSNILIFCFQNIILKKSVNNNMFINLQKNFFFFFWFLIFLNRWLLWKQCLKIIEVVLLSLAISGDWRPLNIIDFE